MASNSRCRYFREKAPSIPSASLGSALASPMHPIHWHPLWMCHLKAIFCTTSVSSRGQRTDGGAGGWDLTPRSHFSTLGNFQVSRRSSFQRHRRCGPQTRSGTSQKFHRSRKACLCTVTSEDTWRVGWQDMEAPQLLGCFLLLPAPGVTRRLERLPIFKPWESCLPGAHLQPHLSLPHQAIDTVQASRSQ